MDITNSPALLLFAINLQCGNSKEYGDSDIAFHFNPRFNGEDSVRNTFQDGGWGDEERDQPNFPFEAKDTFEVAINCQADELKLYVNGKHYINYAHRIDFNRICHILLNGDADFFEPEFI